MRILLLSGYDAASHRRWYEQLTQLPLDWTVLALPARHFPWRTRSNALTWALGPDRAILDQPFDLVIATSMVDVATLKGLVPNLAALPWITYWHENQFAYPVNPKAQSRLVNLQMLTVYTALASTVCVFNSAYNRSTFLEGATQLLKRMPDLVPEGVVDAIRARSRVIPVPLSDAVFKTTALRTGPLRILWNHRWEYDKAPERFFAALRGVVAKGGDFRLVVVGQSFRQIPEAFAQAQLDFADRIVQWGFLESRAEYQALLGSCDVAVSTALHEFQGLAILEAAVLGCQPLVPNRLAYPEHFGGENIYDSCVDDSDQEAETLAEKLKFWADHVDMVRGLPRVDLDHLSWSSLRPNYEGLISDFST